MCKDATQAVKLGQFGSNHDNSRSLQLRLLQ